MRGRTWKRRVPRHPPPRHARARAVGERESSATPPRVDPRPSDGCGRGQKGGAGRVGVTRSWSPRQQAKREPAAPPGDALSAKEHEARQRPPGPKGRNAEDGDDHGAGARDQQPLRHQMPRPKSVAESQCHIKVAWTHWWRRWEEWRRDEVVGAQSGAGARQAPPEGKRGHHRTARRSR